MRVAIRTVALGVICLSATLSADLNDQRAFVRRLYTTLAGAPANGGGMVVMLSPGIVFDSWDDPLSPAFQYALSRTLDRLLPRRQWLYEPTGSSISDLYEQVLVQGIWATSSLTATERQELTKINSGLFTDANKQTPTATFKQYLTLKERRDNLRKKWESTPPADRTPDMQLELQEAEEDLALKGNQAKFVGLLARRDTLLAKSPNRWAADLLTRFKTSGDTFTGEPYHKSALRGMDDESLNASEWTTVAFQFQGNGSAGDSSLPLPADWRLWRIQNTGGVQWLDSQATRIDIRYEVRAFDIQRDWMDASVFSSRAWKWPANLTQTIAGSGDSDLMPVIPTHALLIRNLQVQGNFTSQELSQIVTAMREGRPTSWGPFATSGTYLTSNSFFRARRVPRGFRVDDPQLIALVCELLPKVPNPDPALTWEQK